MKTDRSAQKGSGLRLLIRGYRHLNGAMPGYLPLSALQNTAQTLTPLLVLFFSARILDVLGGSRDLGTITLWVLCAVGTGFLGAVASALAQRRLRVVEELQYTHVRYLLSSRFMDLDYSLIEDMKTTEELESQLAAHNGNGMGLAQLYFCWPGLVRTVVGTIGSIVMAAGMFRGGTATVAAGFWGSPWVFALFPLLAVPALLYLRHVLRIYDRENEEILAQNPKTNTYASYAIQYVRREEAAKEVRLYHQEEALLEQAEERAKLQPFISFFSSIGRMQATINSLGALMGGAAYVIIGLRALLGIYGIGSVVQYVGAVTRLVQSLLGLRGLANLHVNQPFLRRYFAYLDLPDEMKSGSLSTEKRSDYSYELEFCNVSFRYPGSESYALKDLSLKLNVGERLAVVGMNGSGKTTMIKLLCRLYDPTEGVITLNGIDIRKYDYKEYLDIFSVVFQDFALLPLTLAQNVAASESIDRACVEDCLARAGFAGRLSTLPEGLDTYLYEDFEKGVTVSGGEAQKIALARALYKDAPFVVLDEPTAALDPKAEQEVYERFNETIGDKSAIFISHRLSSCRFCDDIAVFDEGRLIQRGRHEELVADRDGKYYELWQAQAQYYS